MTNEVNNYYQGIFITETIMGNPNGDFIDNSPRNIDGKVFTTDETVDSLILEVEAYNRAKNCAYLKNNEYKISVKEVNNYKNNFFLTHLFTLGLEDISKAKFNITLEDFNKAVNQVLKDFRQKTVSKGAA